jgi:hypothetical protein
MKQRPLHLLTASEATAQRNATGRAMNPGGHDPRAQVRSVYDGSYTPEAPVRSETELPSQTRIHELEKQLSKSKDPLERDQLGQDLTFEKLRRAHGMGRI